MDCEHCGAGLAYHEGECYCPDCTLYQTEEEARRADDEARVLRLALVQAARLDDMPTDDGPPF